jgi:S1-C subfamily serine protease
MSNRFREDPMPSMGVTARRATAGSLLAGAWRLLLVAPLLVPSAGWPAPPRQVDRAITPRADLLPDEKATIALFEHSRGSVVFISTADFVRDIFSRNVEEIPRGTGSGFIWDDAGHVITNYHVIEGASAATIKLADGRDYRAALVGASPSHDIAVLGIRVDMKRPPPPPVPIGTSADLRVGQRVYAIGNPFGLDWTLTTGIVSALDRSLAPPGGGRLIEHLIQTDAAINPGNSGGPLLDSAGRLIGINASILSPSGASAGIGFAIPVDTVMRVVPQLIRYGKYRQPSLGIQTDESVNARLKEAFGQEGVFVLRVGHGSGAEKAGLRALHLDAAGRPVPGDIVKAVEGKEVDSVPRLLARLDDFQIGDTVTLEILRNGKSIKVPVRLEPAR